MRISDWSSDVCPSDLVLDDQQRARLAADFGYLRFRLLRLLGNGQKYPYGRSFARPAVDFSMPARLGNEAIDLAQTQAGALADFLGGEKRVESPCLHLRRHPLSGIRHRSEEHTSELQSLMRISYAVFCLKKKQYN